MKNKTLLSLFTIALLIPPAAPAEVKDAASSETRPQPNLRRYVPDTVSEGWRQVYAALPDPTKAPHLPGPHDIEGWKKAYHAVEQGALKAGEEAVKRLQVSVTSRHLGGVPVLEITPKDWTDNGKRLVYTHGGAYGTPITTWSRQTTVRTGSSASRCSSCSQSDARRKMRRATSMNDQGCKNREGKKHETGSARWGVGLFLPTTKEE